jgi:hypothetical protein
MAPEEIADGIASLVKYVTGNEGGGGGTWAIDPNAGMLASAAA